MTDVSQPPPASAAANEPTALGDSALPEISARAPAVRLPLYDRNSLRAGIVHVGVGGFHRSHLATYADELCAAGNQDWGIVGAGVMPGDAAMAEALRPQDHLYTLITRGPEHTEVEVIGSIVGYIHAAVESDRFVQQIADPATQIVSLTVTEGGYPFDDVTGTYVETSPNAGPGSAFALICSGLDARRSAGGGAVTIMSCDNIMENGAAARASTMGEAARVSADLVDWIEANVSFPNSMVDRITPATAPADGQWLAESIGIIDRWPVVAEPFRQWVIEDHFAGERPPLESLDIIITDDVQPYEFMKLRLLNAGHSCLAYLAALDGIESVDAAMAEPAIAGYVDRFLRHESKPVLPAVAGVDVDEYIDSLIERFSNPQIGDQISRLCLDGSAKFPKFLLPTVRAQIAAGGPLELGALALAGWCQYLLGTTDHGDSIELSADPALETAVGFANQSVDDPAAFLGFVEVFGEDIGASLEFVRAFSDALGRLRSGGIRSAISACVAGA